MQLDEWRWEGVEIGSGNMKPSGRYGEVVAVTSVGQYLPFGYNKFLSTKFSYFWLVFNEQYIIKGTIRRVRVILNHRPVKSRFNSQPRGRERVIV